MRSSSSSFTDRGALGLTDVSRVATRISLVLFALLFTLLIPVLVVTIVAASLHGTDASVSIRLPVVDEDRGPVAGALIEALARHLRVEETDRPAAESLVSARKPAAGKRRKPAR